MEHTQEYEGLTEHLNELLASVKQKKNDAEKNAEKAKKCKDDAIAAIDNFQVKATLHFERLANAMKKKVEEEKNQRDAQLQNECADFRDMLHCIEQLSSDLATKHEAEHKEDLFVAVKDVKKRLQALTGAMEEWNQKEQYRDFIFKPNEELLSQETSFGRLTVEPGPYEHLAQLPGQITGVSNQDALTASMLAAAPPQEQKQMLGERLYPLIQRIQRLDSNMVGKITGMLLEIDNSELLHMLEHSEVLKAGVEDAMTVLQAAQDKEKAPTHYMQQATRPGYKYPHQMAQQNPCQAIVVPGQDALTASMLAAAPPQKQKQMLGERLYPLVQRIQRMDSDLAGKITGMLLEIDNSELLHMLEHSEALKAGVEDAMTVLQTAQDKEKAPTHHMQQATRSGYKYSHQMAQQPVSMAIVVPYNDALTAAMLAAAPPQEQKQMLGKRLFPLIQRMHPELAGKITGMLLEMDNFKLLHMLESSESLKAKVEEAVAVLQAHQAKENAAAQASSQATSARVGRKKKWKNPRSGR